ncbi:MAG TPA: Xaa-Pro peptidase family protein [Terriglobales bacterium]|nr:Xaa-Pro peptidase family protein [Terriglobales bacterium]
MSSRRKFLRLTGAAAAATAAVSVTGLPELSAQEKGALPESIAAIPSMRSQAKPITVDERKQRIERARELMRANNLGGVFMIGGTSLVYFTGIRWWNSERLGALLLLQNGKHFFVAPFFEEQRLREQVSQGPLAGEADVLTWNEHEDPYALVAKGLRDRGVTTGQLGIEERTTFVFSDGVAKALPAMKTVSGTPVTAGCRMIKSAHELELMQLANNATLKVYEAVWKALKPGMKQDEAENLLTQGFHKVGFPGGASVQVGQYTANPHGSLTPQVLEEGTIIMIDDGCNVEGYQSDITRTFVIGKPTDKMKQVFDIVHRAQAAALAAARPKAQAQSVDAAARKVIVDAGYGPDYKYFGHRLGHGIGMDGHEWPYLVRGDTLPLQPNMTFSDEPGIYIQGEFGVRLEDDMHITQDGAQLFTPQSPSLEEPFAAA